MGITTGPIQIRRWRLTMTESTDSSTGVLVYGADAYRHLEGLKEIRVNYLSYIRGQGSDGINHVVQEFTDNINDENGVHPTDGFVFIFFDRTHNRLQFIVHDNGRGIPPEVLEKSFTVRNFGTKFKDEVHAKSKSRVYKASGGALGVGSKIGPATASIARAVSCRGQEGHAMLTVVDGEIVRENNQTAHYPNVALSANPAYFGTTIVFEPDLPRFFGSDALNEYEQQGITELLNSIGKYCYFYNVSFTVYLIEHGLDIRALTTPDEIYTAVQSYKSSGQIIFSRDTFNSEAWLHRYWNVADKFIWGLGCNSVVSEDLAVNIQMYMSQPQKSRAMRNIAVLGMVNGIQLDNPKADHVSKLVAELKTALSKRMDDNRTLVDFLMADTTSLPLYIAVSVRFEYAKFVGATKHDFRLREFEAPYRAFLSQYFEQPEIAARLDELSKLIRPWLEMQFAIATGLVQLSKSDNKTLRERLGDQSSKFADTSIADRSKAELLIVEGASAKPARYDDHQAYYLLRGKPSNCMISDNPNEVRAALVKDEIYRALIQIIGINISNPDDMSTIRYGKIVIMADGDAHGSHIASILIVNLWMICPKLVEEGRILVIQPPFHEITYKSQSFYANNSEQFLLWSILNVVMGCFDIDITYLNGQITRLPQEAALGFFKSVYTYGRQLELLAKENNTSINTAEIVYFAIPYLTEQYCHELQELFPEVSIRYAAETQLLYVSTMERDEVINCQNVERYYDAMRECASVLRPKLLRVYITTKHSDIWKKHPLSLVQVYELLESILKMFKVRDLKGIGSMQSEDFYDTCIIPSNRVRFTRQISTAGDVRKMIALMNKERSAERKLVVR